MRRESEKEWYYGNADKERLGPYSFDEVTFNVVSSHRFMLTLFTTRLLARGICNHGGACDSLIEGLSGCGGWYVVLFVTRTGLLCLH